MRIAIVGCGALGLYYGALLDRLAQSRDDLTLHFLARSDYDRMRTSGIIVHSVNGDFRLDRVSAYESPEDIGPVDLVLIGLKTTANDQFSKLIPPLVEKKRTTLLTLQNGIGNEAALASLSGEEHVLGGTAFLCCNRIAPAEISHTDYGYIQIAPFAGSFIGNTDGIAGLFRSAGIDCEVQSSHLEMRWRKQVWNVSFNGLCTLFDTHTASILKDDTLVSRARNIMHEVVALSTAIHKATQPDYSWGIDASLVEEQVQKTTTMGNYEPSMLIDRRNGRALEVESIVSVCLSERDRHAPRLPLPEIDRLNQDLRTLNR